MKREDPCCGSLPGRAERRRRQIVDAARKLFIEKGFHATGVAQIARGSGVAIGQIYRDFEGKEDIVAAIVESDCTAFFARPSLDRALAAGDSEAIWDWLNRLVHPLEMDRGTVTMFAEISAESARNERIAAIFARTHQQMDANLRAAFTRLAPGDHLADRRARLADLVLTQSLGLKQHHLLRPDLDMAPLVTSILALIRREIDRMRDDPAHTVLAA